MYIFQGSDEGADIKVIVPHEKIAECGHGIFRTDGLTKLVLLVGNVGLF